MKNSILFSIISLTLFLSTSVSAQNKPHRFHNRKCVWHIEDAKFQNNYGNFSSANSEHSAGQCKPDENGFWVKYVCCLDPNPSGGICPDDKRKIEKEFLLCDIEFPEDRKFDSRIIQDSSECEKMDPALEGYMISLYYVDDGTEITRFPVCRRKKTLTVIKVDPMSRTKIRRV